MHYNELLLHVGHQFDHSALPALISFVIFIFGLNDIEIALCILFLLLQHARKITQKVQFRPSSVQFFMLADTLKSVAHNRDHHIEHSHLGEKSRKHEEGKTEESSPAFSKVICAILAKG